MENVTVVTDTDALFAVPPVLRAEVEEKAKHDASRRLQDEKRIVELLRQIHEKREQLYTLRWNQNTSAEEKKQALLDHGRELSALSKAFEKAQKEAAAAYELSLALETLGIRRGLESLEDGLEEDDVAKTLNKEQLLSIQKARETQDKNELEELRLMKVRSYDVTKDKSPAERFAMLYGMFHPEGEPGATAAASASKEQEIVRLRGQIDSLKQRTNMSQADKVLLHDLQMKLKAAQHSGVRK